MSSRKRQNANVCPSCGFVVEKPSKTWHIVSPMPDAHGRITVSVMASFVCPRCGSKWKGVVSKVKVGETDIEVEGGGGKSGLKSQPEARRQGEVIELDINDIMERR